MKDDRREVVVVTGASAGVGRAVVRAFARRGARIGLIARGHDGLEGAKRDVEELGGEALVIIADVADAEALEAGAENVERTFGPIDIWINNAMASVFSPVTELTFEEVKRVTEVTYLGVVYGTMVALRRMRSRDHGTIVQVGSALAYRGIPLQAAYCGAKHAIQGFNDSLYSELLHDRSNVRLTMVNLPAVNTPQFNWVRSRLPRRAKPMGTIYQPEVAARAIVWAAKHDRREINVGWPVTKAVVGNAFFPGYGDTYLAERGYEQMTEEPEDPGRRDNLFEPLPGDHGAHGRFDGDAIDRSLHLEANLNRSRLVPLAATLIAAAIAATRSSPQTKLDREKRATALSQELREANGDALARRRCVVALAATATASMMLIALYQMGILKHLPEPPLPMMNADKVDASAEAYQRFDTPDAVLGLGSYAVTMGLAAMGGADRAKEKPWVPIALAAKVAFDAMTAAKLTVDQATKHKAFCFWCLIAAAATFAMIPAVLPEARAAMRAIQGRSVNT